MPFKKIKVLIVDDSLFFRTALQRSLAKDSYIEVIGSASSANEAERLLDIQEPDVITLDVEMPGKKGTDFLREVIPKHPVPVVLVSALKMSVFEALQMGAIDFVGKPDMTKDSDFASFANELSVKVKIASSATVRKKTSVTVKSTLTLNPATLAASKTIVAIGASTGGTEATLEIIKQLPADFPPVLITQHMPAGFTKMYSERLNKICNMRVEEAVNGMRLEKGLAIIAAGENHMTLQRDVRGYYVRSAEGEKVSGHCPSVDVLFSSVAKVAGKDAIGVILTGMGRDGASGLLEMRQKGSYTIGQNKESCVVYGMPMVAYQIGAVEQEAPIQQIAGMLIKKLNNSR